MLSVTFKFRLPEISSSPALKDLICSFAISRPSHVISPPSWDLDKVLKLLRGPPFEPLDSIDLKHLTQKCLFLVALATAKRVSEL